MLKSKTGILSLICTFNLCALAADTVPDVSFKGDINSRSKAANITIQDEKKEPGKTIHVVQGKPETILIPPLPEADGRYPALRFRAWFAASGHDGWNPFLTVKLNGKPIPPIANNGNSRLLNRNRFLGTTKHSPCYLWTMADELVTFFTSDPEIIDSSIVDPEQKNEGCWYVIDLSGMVRPGESNSITLSAVNIRPQYYGATKNEDVPVLVDNFSMGYIDKKTITGLRPAIPFVEAEFNSEVKCALGEITIERDKSGGLRIMRGKQKVIINSQFSIPGGEWLIMGALPEIKGTNTVISALLKKPNAISIEGANGPLQIKRRISFEKNTLFFEDSYINLTNRPIGVISRIFFNVGSKTEELRLGGNFSAGLAAVERLGALACNPTLFWGTENGGVGVMVLDTVFRAQLRARGHGNTGELWTENLMIKPETTVKLRWRLNLEEDKDYWTFINRLRKDLGSNFTIEGDFFWQWDISDPRGGGTRAPDNAWWCSGPKFNRLEEGVLKKLSRMPVKIACLSPWFKYYDGLGFDAPGYRKNDFTREEYLKVYTTSKNIIKAQLPACKVIGAMEIQLEAVKRSDVEKVSWRDSIRTAEDGSVKWHAQSVMNNKQGYGLAPTYISLDNKHFSTVMERIKFLIEEVKLDGIYFDLWDISGNTYNRGDGFSCIINPKTHELEKEICFVSIIAGPAQKKIADYLLGRNKIIVANCAYGVEELHGLPIFCFTEGVVVSEGGLARHHLLSPIVLMPSQFHKKSSILMKFILDYIDKGLLPYCGHYILPDEDTAAYRVLNMIFPFTPVSVRPGVLLGKERLITTRAGNYFWSKAEHDNKKPGIFIFNKKAEIIRDVGKVENTHAGWNVDLNNMPLESMAIVVGENEERGE